MQIRLDTLFQNLRKRVFILDGDGAIQMHTEIFLKLVKN